MPTHGPLFVTLLIGTVLQVPLLLTGLFGSAMWLVGGLFVLIWAYLLQVRKDLLGSPFGAVRVSGAGNGDGGVPPTP